MTNAQGAIRAFEKSKRGQKRKRDERIDDEPRIDKGSKRVNENYETICDTRAALFSYRAPFSAGTVF